jgi:chromosome segregation ATPase
MDEINQCDEEILLMDQKILDKELRIERLQNKIDRFRSEIKEIRKDKVRFYKHKENQFFPECAPKNKSWVIRDYGKVRKKVYDTILELITQKELAEIVEVSKTGAYQYMRFLQSSWKKNTVMPLDRKLLLIASVLQNEKELGLNHKIISKYVREQNG